MELRRCTLVCALMRFRKAFDLPLKIVKHPSDFGQVVFERQSSIILSLAGGDPACPRRPIWARMASRRAVMVSACVIWVHFLPARARGRPARCWSSGVLLAGVVEGAIKVDFDVTSVRVSLA